jgi:pimeloyl-ACP methyl ester carboxylesterase
VTAPESPTFTSGKGPPLVLVHGLLGDHTRWEALRPHLEPHFTVHAMDRRGRGASGDAPEYAFERECEDVAAVVDAVARRPGRRLTFWAAPAARSTPWARRRSRPNIRRLALFEPPPTDMAQLLPSGLLERLDALLAEGDREGVLVAAYRAIVGLSVEEIDHLRSQPAWPNRIAAAHTVPRELRFPPDSAFSVEQAKTIHRYPRSSLSAARRPGRIGTTPRPWLPPCRTPRWLSSTGRAMAPRCSLPNSSPSGCSLSCKPEASQLSSSLSLKNRSGANSRLG